MQRSVNCTTICIRTLHVAVTHCGFSPHFAYALYLLCCREVVQIQILTPVRECAFQGFDPHNHGLLAEHGPAIATAVLQLLYNT